MNNNKAMDVPTRYGPLVALCLVLGVLPTATAAAPSAHAPTVARAASSASAAARAGSPDLRSSSAIVVDESDASVVYAKGADVVAPVASITKLMTALVVIDGRQPLDEPIEITSADRDTEHGSASRLAVGARLTRGDLLQLALMSSENRAAHALARNYPGGTAGFVGAMNARAQALGMTTARFVDASGLSNENVSSAADLVKLVSAASREPLIRRYSTAESHTVQVRSQLLEFRNTNTLVAKPDWDIAVQKTGYTLAAGQCLVMQTVIQGRSVVMVFLNSFGKLTRAAEARRVRRWLEGGAQPSQVARSGR